MSAQLHVVMHEGADRAELAARVRAATLAGNAAHLAGVPTVVERIRAEIDRRMVAEYDRLILGDPDAPPIRLVGLLGGGPA